MGDQKSKHDCMYEIHYKNIRSYKFVVHMYILNYLCIFHIFIFYHIFDNASIKRLIEGGGTKIIDEEKATMRRKRLRKTYVKLRKYSYHDVS